MRTSQQGFSLVEVLVALVVLSVGMLGIAALYVDTMRSSRTALVRMQAVNLANDMADRIRANPRARMAYQGAAALHACVGGGVSCSPEDLAADDLFRWRTSLAAALPGAAAAAGTVVFTPGAGIGRPDQYDINITWQEPGEVAPVTYNYSANMQMIPVLP